MSPEQGMEYGADRSTDNYSWGVVFYELITGLETIIGRYSHGFGG